MSAAIAGLELLVTIDELSEYLGVPKQTIYSWQATGNGPRATRVGRHLKYRVRVLRRSRQLRRSGRPPEARHPATMSA
ncbi:helix-turn-helix domain-containing protein [Microbacterium sp. SYP-A9085]|nr:helix-turn-helix domain-containing protein [Microbacterium sp. SYP-A9085]MRH29645.1 helix-turn-helix domain-containing protein [Microbacterium sp. SYP-A9085]